MNIRRRAAVFQMSLLLTGLMFFTFTATRLILLVYSGFSKVSFSAWPLVLGKGFLCDLATLAYVIPPALILDLTFNFFLPKTARRSVLTITWVSITTFTLLFLSVIEIAFWVEFQTRLNFIALDYLIYTNEVLANIWQSYPIVWILLGLAMVSLGLAMFLNRRLTSYREPRLPLKVSLLVFALALLAPFLSFKLVSVETMHGQGNTFADELSGNGLFTLVSAAHNNDLDYDRFYATIPAERAETVLKGLGVEWSGSLSARSDAWGDDSAHDPLPDFLFRRPKNIILISVESLSAKFLGAYGSTENLTPHLDRIAKESLMFRRVYATGTRTVRGLEALSLGIPPVPGQAIVRRPKNQMLTSLGHMLRRQNYNVLFFYGGHGYFDNMNAFFKSNEYDVFDRSSISDDHVTFENAWGVADEDLYSQALRVLDQNFSTHRPFFAHIMTTSNHRPYTYPDGRIDIPSPGRRSGAVKYTDYAIGDFLERAKTKPWFRDTLFVLTADHCASVAGQTELPVPDYEIPLFFYGPTLVKPGIYERMISQIDIAPTLLDLIGMAGDDHLFGKEIMEQEGSPRAFISTYQYLGYYKNDRLIVLKPNRHIEAYAVDPITRESKQISNLDPTLVEEAIAYYQISSAAFKAGKLSLIWE